MSVHRRRALPDVRDASSRAPRILYRCTRRADVVEQSSPSPSANVGDVLKKYHPHDTSV